MNSRVLWIDCCESVVKCLVCSGQDERACDEGPQYNNQKAGFHNLISIKDSSGSVDSPQDHFRG